MARQDAMAAIDRALNPPPKPEEQEEEKTTLVSPLPGVEPPKPEKKLKPEKKTTEAARQQEAIEQAFTHTPDDMAIRRDVNLSGVQKAYNAFWSTLTKVGNATKGGLEALPTPGSIAVPLILLLVFFFLLIPINGHTRFVWLWLVLSGNAEISPSQGATVAGGTFSEQIPTTPQLPTVTLSVPMMTRVFMTGAGEDFL